MKGRKRSGWHKQPWRSIEAIGAPAVEVSVMSAEPLKEYLEDGVRVRVFPPGWAEGAEPSRTVRPRHQQVGDDD